MYARKATSPPTVSNPAVTNPPPPQMTPTPPMRDRGEDRRAREGFLNRGGRVGDMALPPPRDLLDFSPHEPGDDEDKRDDRAHHQGQLPLQSEEGDDDPREPQSRGDEFRGAH